MFRNRISIAIATLVVVLGVGMFMQISFDNSDEQATTTTTEPSTSTMIEQVTTTTELALVINIEDISTMQVAQRIPADQPFEDVVSIGDCRFNLSIDPDGSFGTSASTCYLGLYTVVTDEGGQHLIESLPIITNGSAAGSGLYAGVPAQDIIVVCAGPDKTSCQQVVFV